MGKVDLIYKIYLERLIISKNKIEMAFSHKGWTRTDKSNSFLIVTTIKTRRQKLLAYKATCKCAQPKKKYMY